MTLILAAVTERAAVIASDGLEFEHSPDQSGKVIKASNRKKLLQLGDRQVVLAVHGQNRIARVGQPIESQELVTDLLTELTPRLQELPTVEKIAAELVTVLTPHVQHTYRELAAIGNHTSRLAICVIGAAAGDSRQRGAEATWPMLTAPGDPAVIRLVQLSDDVRIVHAGSGEKFVLPVVRNPKGPFHPNRLRRAKVPDLQEYVRGVYRASLAIQPEGQAEFGGAYHEFTISNGQCAETTPPAS